MVEGKNSFWFKPRFLKSRFIRPANLAGEYKKIEPDCREGVKAQLERMKELCQERNNLYKIQNDLKGQKYKIKNRWNDKKYGAWRLLCPIFCGK